MGTPISPLDPVAFVLGKATVCEEDLTPEQRREILTAVLQRAKPHLKYLPQLKVFSRETAFDSAHPWRDARVKMFLPFDMPENTRCLGLWCVWSRKDQDLRLIITRGGRLFWLLTTPEELGPEGRPGIVLQNAWWLDDDAVHDLGKGSRTTRSIVHGLHAAVGEAVDLRRARLFSSAELVPKRQQGAFTPLEQLRCRASGAARRLQKRQERLASVERLHRYLGGILSRMT